MEFDIPLTRPYRFSHDETMEVGGVIKSGFLTGGKYSKEFEGEFAAYVGTEYCVSVNSGYSALKLSLESLNSGGGKVVIVPTYSFVASANAVVNAGLTPCFCDINEETLNLDVNSIKDVSGCVGIMPVNIAGVKYDTSVDDFAEENDLVVVEDSAERVMDYDVSSDICCYSFHANKNLTTGEGGMIATDDEGAYDFCISKRGHGVFKDKKFYKRNCRLPGDNYRLTEFQAKMGLIQLRKIHEFTERRQDIASMYNKRLSKLDFIRTPEVGVKDSSWQMYIIRVDSSIRDDLVDYLRRGGIEVSVHFDPLIHQTDYYASGECFVVAEKVCREVISLPMYPGLSDEEIQCVVDKIGSYKPFQGG